MITALFVILVVGAIGLHYVLVDRPRLRKAERKPSTPEAIPLSEAMVEPPGSFFLQPSFTWTRIRESGEFFVGIHPLLLSLVGPDIHLETVPDDSTLERGDPLLRLCSGEKEIRLFSPLAGQIVEVNDRFLPQTGWVGATSRGGSWLYRIRPRGAEGDMQIPTWMLGASASRWAHEEYREVKDFLLETLDHEEVGLSAADGGELPAGVLSQLDGGAWETFQARFIPDPAETEAGE